MATAALPRPAAKNRLGTYDEMIAELPESNLPMELWDGEIIMSKLLSGFQVTWSQLIP
jgi:hypothetical protein